MNGKYRCTLCHEIKSTNVFEEVGKIDENISIFHIEAIAKNGDTIYNNGVVIVENGVIKYKALSTGCIGGNVYVSIRYDKVA